MMEKVTIKTAKEFIKFLIEQLTFYKVVDDTIMEEKDGQLEPFKLTYKSKKYEVKLFDEPLPTNCIILNPFVESSAFHKDKDFFYDALVYGFIRKVATLLQYLINCSIIDKEEQEKLPVTVTDILSNFEFDEKTAKELSILIKEPLDFINVYYDKRKKAARFRTLVFEDAIFDMGIRKKTINQFRKFFFMMLKCKTVDEVNEEFTVKTDNMYCPFFDSIIKLYYKLYSRCNPYFELINQDIDIEQFSKYIDKIEEMYHQVKWIIPGPVEDKSQPKKSSIIPTIQQKPSGVMKIGNIPIITSSPGPIQPVLQPIGPINPVQPQQPMMQQPQQSNIPIVTQQPNYIGNIPIV